MIKKMITTVLILFGFSIFLYPLMYMNHAECFFIPNVCDNGESATISVTVPVSTFGVSIADGACFYLDSYSCFLGYLKEYEAGNMESREALIKACENIKAADDIYKKIIEVSATYSYNDTAIDRLKSFDYDTFGKTFDLNPRVFGHVRVLLSKGDVRGVFREIRNRFRVIAGYLSASETDSIPGKTDLWRINQYYAETLLFGQYAAEIFDRCR